MPKQGKFSLYNDTYFVETSTLFNDNYQINNHEAAEGELNIYSSNFKDKKKIKIDADSITAIKISDFDKSKILRKKIISLVGF